MLDEVLLNCLLDVCIRLKVPWQLGVGSSRLQALQHPSGHFAAAPSPGPFETTGTSETLGNDGTGTLASCARVAIHHSPTIDKSIRASSQVSSGFELRDARPNFQLFLVLGLLSSYPLGSRNDMSMWEECPKQDPFSVGATCPGRVLARPA